MNKHVLTLTYTFNVIITLIGLGVILVNRKMSIYETSLSASFLFLIIFNNFSHNKTLHK